MTSGRLLAIFDHPDDESLVAGGTLARCVSHGVTVKLLCVTRGEQWPISDDHLATPETLGSVREAELTDAARVLGVQEIECLHYPDGELESIDSWRLREDIALAIVQWHPEAVMTFGPEGLYRHPDHMVLNRVTCGALDQLATDGPSPWLYYATWPRGWVDELVAALAARGLPADLWGHQPDEFGAPANSITTVVDVREFAARKLAALRCHRTRLGPSHLVSVVPDDLAHRFFGTEFFVRSRPAVRGPDWLQTRVWQDCTATGARQLAGRGLEDTGLIARRARDLAAHSGA